MSEIFVNRKLISCNTKHIQFYNLQVMAVGKILKDQSNNKQPGCMQPLVMKFVAVHMEFKI